MSRRASIVRRTLALGLLVILLVALGLPAALGWQLSKYHDYYVQQLSVPGVLEVRDVAFSRGILRSRSRVKLAAAPEVCGQDPCPVITVDSVIHHGPIAFTAPPATPGGLQVGLGVVVSRADVSPLFDNTRFEPRLPKLEVVTRVDLAGAVDSAFMLPAERLRASGDDTGARLSLERLEATLHSPAGHAAVRGQLNWPGFELVADSGGQIGLQGLSSQFSGDANTPRFWQRAGLKLNALQIVDPQGDSLSLQGLLWDAHNTAEPGGHLASEFSTRLSQMTLGNREYGPIILEGQIRGLDVASLGAMQAAVRSLKPQVLPPELLLLAISGIYQAHMPALLAAGPELSISRFLAGTPDGDIIADLSVSLANIPDAGTDFTAVIQRLQLALNLRLPAATVEALVRRNMQASEPSQEPSDEDVKAALDALTEAKWLVARPEENSYVTQLRIENQNLTVNGKVRDGWQETLDALASGKAPAATKQAQPALQ